MSHPENPKDMIIVRYLTGAKFSYLEDEWLSLIRQLLEEANASHFEDLISFFEGYIQISIKKYESAILKFLEALSLNDQLTYPWYGLGTVYYYQKDYDKAIKAFRKSIELDEKFARPWNGLGAVYVELKDYDKAIEAFRVAIELDDKYTEPWNGLGAVYVELKDYDKAIEAYRKLIDLNDRLASSHRTYGLLLQKLNRSSEAKRHLIKAQKLFDSEDDSFFDSIVQHHLKLFIEKSKNVEIAETKRSLDLGDKLEKLQIDKPLSPCK